MEASEEIQNLKQKLSIQMEKCNTLEVQQNILMDILNIPPEKRNFSSLREDLEHLKNLACQIPIPQDFSVLSTAKISEQEPETPIVLNFEDIRAVVPDIETKIKVFLENVIHDSVAHTENDDRKTVTCKDVAYALMKRQQQ